jgi:hypothetical protein
VDVVIAIDDAVVSDSVFARQLRIAATIVQNAPVDSRRIRYAIIRYDAEANITHGLRQDAFVDRYSTDQRQLVKLIEVVLWMCVCMCVCACTGYDARVVAVVHRARCTSRSRRTATESAS